MRSKLNRATRPHEAKYAYTLAFCLGQHGDTEEAIVTLRWLAERDTLNFDPYVLYGQLYAESGRLSEAADVYRKAAAHTRFPDAARAQFTARAAQLGSAP